MFVCLCFLSVLLVAYGGPSYPLYAISSKPSETTEADIEIIASNFTYIHGKFNSDQLQKMSQRIQAVSYINSEVVEADLLEQSGRFNASYYSAGQLVHILDKDSTSFLYQPASKVSVLISSTTSLNKSVNSTNYVIFVRIDSELLKIIGVESKGKNGSYLIKVVRGFEYTKRTAHKSGATVFGPVYNSNRSPGKSGKLSYMIDPSGQLAVNILVNHTLSAVNAGYNGSWFDLFSAGENNAVDMGGANVKTYWNFAKDQNYTKDDFVLAQQHRLTTVFTATQKILGKYPAILANNMHGCWYSDKGDCQQLVVQSANVRPLDGYCMENFAGYESAENGGCQGKIDLYYQPFDKWLYNVQVIMDAAQKNLSAFPMIGSAGCQSVGLEIIGGPDRDKYEAYAYASYLLAISNSSGKTRLGIPAFYTNGSVRYAHVHPRYFWPIGEPLEHAKNVTEYQTKLKGHASFVRSFTGGLVVVNPSNTTDSNFPLGGKYIDPNTKESLTALNVGKQSGYILLKDKLLFS